MKNKNGFTLVELIVVVALMGVILGAVGLSVGNLSGQKTKTASRSVYNMLGTAQTLALSKGNTLFGIIYEDGTCSACIFYKSNEVGSTYSMIQSTEINKTVSLTFKAGSTTYGIGTGSDTSVTYCDGLIISIDRSTGRFDGTYIYTGSQTAPYDEDNPISNCTNIYIGSGDGQKNIALVSTTGKFYFVE